MGSWRRGVQVREANLLGLGDTASWVYTNTQGSNAVDFSYTLPVNARNGTLTLLGLKARGFLDHPVDLLVDATTKE